VGRAGTIVALGAKNGFLSLFVNPNKEVITWTPNHYFTTFDALRFQHVVADVSSLFESHDRYAFLYQVDPLQTLLELLDGFL
jgi:hypothetical protein